MRIHKRAIGAADPGGDCIELSAGRRDRPVGHQLEGVVPVVGEHKEMRVEGLLEGGLPSARKRLMP